MIQWRATSCAVTSPVLRMVIVYANACCPSAGSLCSGRGRTATEQVNSGRAMWRIVGSDAPALGASRGERGGVGVRIPAAQLAGIEQAVRVVAVLRVDDARRERR